MDDTPRALTPTESALRAWLGSVDPSLHGWAAVKLQRIRDAIDRDQRWTELEEWRPSTWFDSRIEVEHIDGRAWFVVSVECDGQRLSCRCPSVERALLYTQLYQHFVASQVFSIAPPWAG